jgi:hypothetical protein
MPSNVKPHMPPDGVSSPLQRGQKRISTSIDAAAVAGAVRRGTSGFIRAPISIAPAAADGYTARQLRPFPAAGSLPARTLQAGGFEE